MALTSDNDPEATITAVVTIRIPSGTNDALVSSAEERLSRGEDVADVTVDKLHGIEPRLSATVLTIGVTIQVDPPLPDVEVHERLADVPGLASVEQTERDGL